MTAWSTATILNGAWNLRFGLTFRENLNMLRTSEYEATSRDPAPSPLGAGTGGNSDIADCANVIFDNDVLAKVGGKRLCNQSGGNVGRPSRGKGNDDLDGSFRIAFGLNGRYRRCRQPNR